MHPFDGFLSETQQFLRDLRENNTRDWYNEHKRRYEKVVKSPAVTWVQAMGTRLQDIDDQLVVDTRTNGSGALMRMARDTRFSKDKTPYKTNIAMLWWRGSGKKTQHPAFGMQITPDDAALMTGIHVFPKSMLAAYRQAVVDHTLGEALIDTVKQLEAAGYEVEGKHYKSTPRGFEKDHPRAEWLKYNALYTHVMDISWDMLLSDQLVDFCFDHFQKMSPLYGWLVEVQDTYGGV